jgi:hypothetical protein
MNQGTFCYVDLRTPLQQMDVDMDMVGFMNDAFAIVNHVLKQTHHP